METRPVNSVFMWSVGSASQKGMPYSALKAESSSASGRTFFWISRSTIPDAVRPGQPPHFGKDIGGYAEGLQTGIEPRRRFTVYGGDTTGPSAAQAVFSLLLRHHASQSFRSICGFWKVFFSFILMTPSSMLPMSSSFFL